MWGRHKWMKAGMIATAAALLLTACSGGSGPAAGESGAGATESASATGGKPSLKVLAFNVGFDPNAEPVAKDIEETTGYKISYTLLPKDNPEEKLNIEIASGANYDILSLTPTQFHTLVAQGALQPIGELVDKHGANMKEAISEASWELGKYNGELYGIPQKNERPNIEQTMIVRQDVMDELGLEMPETLDEFYETLLAIKQKKPDMIPLTGAGMNVPMVLSAFGLYTGWAEDESGQLLPRIKRPEMKEYMTFMKKLFDEGLLDKDWPINKSAQSQEKFVGGKAAMISGDWNMASGIHDAFKTNVPEGRMGYMPPLKGPDGSSGVEMADKLLYVHAIPKSSKNAEDAIKFMNLKLEKNNFTFLTLGEEGVTFTEENGVYSPIMPTFTEQRGSAYFFLNGIREVEYADMWLARLRRTPTLFEAFNELNKDFDTYAKRNPIAFMPPIEAVGKNLPSLTQRENDYFLQVLLSGEKIEEFDKFLSGWESAGGGEVLKAVNEWYVTTKK
ncbi:extracellular solute-binding protein [Cohnella hongkongensis]|uniref:Extracellular solute-binding protein n=1 Tax=Cohnella hongkongensis TaxID=178337 RepID=A0ABV9FFR4_9BACL